MDRCDAAAGHLVVFDRRKGRSWDEKVFRGSRTAESGAEVEFRVCDEVDVLGGRRRRIDSGGLWGFGH